MSARHTPAETARMDQGLAAASEAVASCGGRLVDTRSALLTVVVDAAGIAHFTGTTTDPRWIANALQQLADAAAERAAKAGQ